MLLGNLLDVQLKMLFMYNFLIFILLGVAAERYNVVPKFYAQDSAIIIDSDQPSTPTSSSSPSGQLPNSKSQSPTLPYYQPLQTIPSYKIFSRVKSKNDSLPSSKNDAQRAAIFTQEEFPRDLLEIAQQKLGLKTLDEVPSVTELAELLGTNSAAETISYIRQLTSTEQGIALMKAYIESSDYTDSVGSINNRDNEVLSAEEEIISTTTMSPSQSNESGNSTSPGFFERIAAFLSIYNVQPQHKEAIEHELQRKRPQSTATSGRILRPLYVRSPLPYHYPIPLRPYASSPLNRTNYNAMRMYIGRSAVVPTKNPKSPESVVHMNTLKALTPAHIQHLARMANMSPRTLESFLQRKPKLAELAAKVVSYPMTHASKTDGQLLAAVHKAIENDEDLRKLLNSSETLK